MKATTEQIEELALRIYDELNPNYLIEIKVSKAACIKLARKRLQDC